MRENRKGEKLIPGQKCNRYDEVERQTKSKSEASGDKKNNK